LTGNGVGNHLILVLPAPKSYDYPDDIAKAEARYGGLFDHCSPERLTLLKVPYGKPPGEEVPPGLKEMLESRGEAALADSAEVLKIPAIDPYAPNWNSKEFFMTYFEPLVKDSDQGHNTVFFLGPGTAFLTALMTQLAVTIGADAVANAPHDEHGTSSVRSLEFVSRGVAQYRELFDGKPLGEPPRKKTRKTRNVLVRMYRARSFNDRWSTARELCGGPDLPESLGFSRSIEPLAALLEEETTLDGVRYSLTPAGVVAAIETRKHHIAAFDSPYHSDDGFIPLESGSGAKGVITGFRAKTPDPTFGEEECNELANGLEGFNPISLVLSHISTEETSSFFDFTPPTDMTKVFRQREKTLQSMHLSVCGCNWDPEVHFVRVLESILSLPNGVDWRLDVTRLANNDQIVFSLICHLLMIPIIYRTAPKGTGARGRKVKQPQGYFPPNLHEHAVPIYSAWRTIHDLVIHGDPETEPMAILEAMNSPNDIVTKPEFDKIVSTRFCIDEPMARNRVETKLLKNGLFTNEGGKGWALTRDGKVVWAFLDARG